MQWGCRLEILLLSPNSSDTDLFRVNPAVGEKFLEDFPHLRDKKIVVYAGTLGFANGVDYIIRLAARMKSQDSNICFVVAGDGAKRDELTAMAHELGVYEKNLWMLAPLPKILVPPLLSAATVACSTFILDAAPWPNSANKFFDGLAAGKPIVINYLGWQKDVLDHSGAGIALPPDDLDGAAGKLKAFLDDDAAVTSASMASAHLADTQYNRNFLARKLRGVLEQAATSAHQYGLSQSSCDHQVCEGPLVQPKAKRASLFQQKR